MTGLNVSSVYRKSQDEIRKILQENNITKILVDIQDCGVRLYTFVWTLYDVMNATDRNITIVVFDRPNPLGGDIVEGPYWNVSCTHDTEKRLYLIDMD